MVRNIVFWLSKYPRSIAGTIKYLSLRYNVTCLCYDKSIFENREKMGWEYDNLDKVNFIYMSSVSNKNDFVIEFVKQHEVDTFHFVMGIRGGGINTFVRKYLLRNKRCKVGMIAERPTMYNMSFVQKMLSFLCYSLLGIYYSSRIKCLLAMGTLGVRAYSSMFWDHGNIYPYLYHKVSNDVKFPSLEVDFSRIRMLYVGQFNKRKGIDLLLDVLDKVDNGNWQLDIVGATGDLEKVVLEKSLKNANINYLGVWKSSEVSSLISSYDVCIVPSRYDGWGMVVMEALEAGIGVITTDTTGSKDLVIGSQAGEVVAASDFDALSKVINKILKDPSVLVEWKQKARQYKLKISDDTIGTYVEKVIGFVENEIRIKPSCPWL